MENDGAVAEPVDGVIPEAESRDEFGPVVQACVGGQHHAAAAAQGELLLD